MHVYMHAFRAQAKFKASVCSLYLSMLSLCTQKAGTFRPGWKSSVNSLYESITIEFTCEFLAVTMVNWFWLWSEMAVTISVTIRMSCSSNNATATAVCHTMWRPVSSLVCNSLLQLAGGLTAQLALQSIVGCCQVESPLVLALGPPVNTSGEGWPG